MKYVHDDEMFDDLHKGVDALREVAQSKSVVLTTKAKQSLERLENNVPVVRARIRVWNRLTDGATKAAIKTNRAAHSYPWVFTLGALAIGLIAGIALQSSDNEKTSDSASFS